MSIKEIVKMIKFVFFTDHQHDWDDICEIDYPEEWKETVRV